MSDEDKALIRAALWADGEIPTITSAEQHKAYARVEQEFSRRLFDPSCPEHSQSFGEWSRSPEGRLAAAYGAKVIEWEERQAGEGSQPDQFTVEDGHTAR